MAQNKTSRYLPAAVHAIVYGIPFALIIQPSLAAMVVIIGTHFLIDRFRLAKYICYAKNFLAPPSYTGLWCSKVEDVDQYWEGRRKYAWRNCRDTGYTSDTPPFMATWLMIIADNTMHLTINYLALSYL